MYFVNCFHFVMLLLFLSWFLTCNGTKWPKLCLFVVKKLLTHSLTPLRPLGMTERVGMRERRRSMRAGSSRSRNLQRHFDTYVNNADGQHTRGQIQGQRGEWSIYYRINSHRAAFHIYYVAKWGYVFASDRQPIPTRLLKFWNRIGLGAPGATDEILD